MNKRFLTGWAGYSAGYLIWQLASSLYSNGRIVPPHYSSIGQGMLAGIIASVSFGLLVAILMEIYWNRKDKRENK
ncbi:MAG: hypothetical protein WCO23_00630 [bacterium]